MGALLEELNSILYARSVVEQDRVTDQDHVDRESWLMIDTNLALDHARKLAEEWDVYYFLTSQGAYPCLHDQITGDGFPIIGIGDMGEVIDKVNYIFIVDCFHGSLADAERKKGRTVFGPSGYWTQIENDRIFGWRELQKMDVGVPDGEVVEGYDAVIEYISKHEDGKRKFFLKLSKHRGNLETTYVKTSMEAKVLLMQSRFGPYLNDIEVLIQHECPGLEIGFDAYTNGKKILTPYLFTIEIKGSGTIGVWTDKSPIDDLILNKIQPSLNETGYRGNISFEFFWDGKRVYCHDPTAREPFPCSALQPRYIKNYNPVVLAVAKGEDIDIEVDTKFVAQITVATDNDKEWRPIRFPDEMTKDIGFRRVVKKDGEVWFVPGDSVVAAPMGSGDTPIEALEAAGKVASEISCRNIYFSADFKDEAVKVIEGLKELGNGLEFEYRR